MQRAEGAWRRAVAKDDIGPLTGVRGVAALWVAAYHLLLPASMVHGLPARLLGRGYLAVDLFFVLSGYVMALNYGPSFGQADWRPAFGRFLWRRVARIYPLYALILVTRLIYTVWRYGTFALPRSWLSAPMLHPWAEMPANLLLVQAWGIAPSSIGPAWSISTEWAAYMVFPLLAGLLLHRGLGWALAGCAGAAGLVVGTAVLLAASGGKVGTLDAWDGQTIGPLMRCVGGFMLGMAIWRLSRWAPAARLAARSMTGWAVIGLLAAALTLEAPDLALYPLFCALVLCLACGTGLPVSVFGTAPLLWLGEISYALYLLHIFLLHPVDLARDATGLFLPRGWADGVTALLIGAILLAASDLTNRWVEQPVRAAVRKKRDSQESFSVLT